MTPDHDFEWARNIFCKDLLCRGKRQDTEDCGICDECCLYVSEHEMIEAERIMAKPEPYRWIPCSKRLPENDTYVLTTIDSPRRNRRTVRSGYYYTGYFSNDNGDHWKDTDKEVKAWMPLPEPYKGKS